MLPFAAFFVSLFMAWVFMQPGSRFYVLDYPNQRSLHERPIPRSGGLAIVLSTLLAGVVLAIINPLDSHLISIGLGVLCVATVSYLDDREQIPIAFRLISHIVSAAILMFAGLVPDSLIFPGGSWTGPSLVSLGIFLLFIVWMINLYNFMDGMDGFAAGMAVAGFGAMGILGWLAGHSIFAILNWIIVAAAGGFLVFNFPPARIFMGDVGSSGLGFLAAAMALWAESTSIFPLWVAVLIFSPFVVDATATLFRRLIRRERIWEAHRSHYYQRLVQLGWGHKRTVLREYFLMLLCGLSAIGIAFLPPWLQWMALAGWGLIYGILAVSISRLEKKKQGAIY